MQETTSPSPEVRLHAAAVLSGLGGFEAEEALVGLLADPDHRVRARAVEGLRTRRPGRPLDLCGRAARPGLGCGGDGGRPRARGAGRRRRKTPRGALELLARRAASRRAGAARRAWPRSASVGALEAALRVETDVDVRAELLLALGRTGRTEAAPVLLRALSDGAPLVRAHAAWALGLLGDPRAAAAAPAPPRRARGRRVRPRGARVASRRPRRPRSSRGAGGAGSEASSCSSRSRARWRAGVPRSPAGPRALALGDATPRRPPSSPRDSRGRPPALSRDLLARLDAAGAAALIVRQGPYPDGYAALAELPPERLVEAARTALVVDDAEPALALLVRGGDAVEPARLLAHPHSRAKVAALNRLTAGATPLPDLLEILADDDPDTALAAAWAVSRETRREGGERARAAAHRSPGSRERPRRPRPGGGPHRFARAARPGRGRRPALGALVPRPGDACGRRRRAVVPARPDRAGTPPAPRGRGGRSPDRGALGPRAPRPASASPASKRAGSCSS